MHKYNITKLPIATSRSAKINCAFAKVPAYNIALVEKSLV